MQFDKMDMELYFTDDLLQNKRHYFWMPSEEENQTEPTEEEKLDVLEQQLLFREYLNQEYKNADTENKKSIIQKEINILNIKMQELMRIIQEKKTM
jgi:hypothetical protein